VRRRSGYIEPARGSANLACSFAIPSARSHARVAVWCVASRFNRALSRRAVTILATASRLAPSRNSLHPRTPRPIAREFRARRGRLQWLGGSSASFSRKVR
jgi:hypothetical protein